MKPAKQKDVVLGWLVEQRAARRRGERVEPLTNLWAILRGVGNLGARVAELRQDGHVIDSPRAVEGELYVEYRLVRLGSESAQADLFDLDAAPDVGGGH